MVSSLTNEKYYQHCKQFIDFALKFLNRTFNETIVESEVSSLEDIETKKRNLNHENAVKLNVISTNSSHPLVSLPLVTDILDRLLWKRLALYACAMQEVYIECDR